MSRPVESCDCAPNQFWCRGCEHWYWHTDTCEIGAAAPARTVERCPSCGTAVGKSNVMK